MVKSHSANDIMKGRYNMSKQIFTIENITAMVKPLAQKYHVKEVYLFGSYARGEADENSDLDFLVCGGESFKLTQIFSFGEELREILQKRVDVFEINEINQDSEFYKKIMREKVLVAWNAQLNRVSKKKLDNSCEMPWI